MRIPKVKNLNRAIFENAIITMEKHGTESMLVPRIFSKRHEIKKSLLQYYESTEEFEKCKFIVDFFTELESYSAALQTYSSQNGATGEFQNQK